MALNRTHGKRLTTARRLVGQVRVHGPRVTAVRISQLLKAVCRTEVRWKVGLRASVDPTAAPSHQTRHDAIRQVQRYDQTADFDRLLLG